jgi:DNA modification methylase
MNARGGSTPFNVVPLANDKESEVTDVLESALLELEENQDFVLQTPHDKVAKYLAKEVKNKANRDNVIMCTGGKKAGSAHGATTPFQLCEYWVNYITPKGGTVLDPFSGTGTVGRAAIKHGFNYIGIERYEDYHIEAEKGLAEVSKKMESIL